jgi:hypothetical protein
MLTGNPVAFALLIICDIAGVLLTIVMPAAFVTAVQRLSADPNAPVGVGENYKRGFGFFWSLLFLAILQGFIFFGSAIFLIIPAIIISVFVSMSTFALVIDGKKGFAALTESFGLVSGRWWAVVGRILCLAVVYIIGALVSSGLGFIINALFGFGRNDAGGIVVSTILNLILSAVMVPLVWVYMYNLYLSLKNSRPAQAATSTFKKWLIAFLCIGIVVVILTPILGGAAIYEAYREGKFNNPQWNSSHL